MHPGSHRPHLEEDEEWDRGHVELLRDLVDLLCLHLRQ